MTNLKIGDLVQYVADPTDIKYSYMQRMNEKVGIVRLVRNRHAIAYIQWCDNEVYDSWISSKQLKLLNR